MHITYTVYMYRPTYMQNQKNMIYVHNRDIDYGSGDVKELSCDRVFLRISLLEQFTILLAMMRFKNAFFFVYMNR